MDDYIPAGDDAKIIWLRNIKESIDAYSAALGSLPLTLKG